MGDAADVVQRGRARGQRAPAHSFGDSVFGSDYWLWTPDRTRTELERRYLSSVDDYREVAGVRLHVRDTGPRDAPALVMLHGFASSLHTWEPWAQMLSDAFRVVRVDLPGAGLTGPDPSGDYSDARTVAVVLALMDGLRIRRAALVGHSFGGRIAWKLAATHPGRVDRLVLVAPDGFPAGTFKYDARAGVPLPFRLMRFVLPKAMLRSGLASAYGDPRRLHDDDVTRYHDLLRGPGNRAAWLARLTQTVVSDPVPVLTGIDAPTLLVWGRKDRFIPVANASQFADALPNAELVIFPELGHVPQEEAPALSLTPVRAFLARKQDATGAGSRAAR